MGMSMRNAVLNRIALGSAVLASVSILVGCEDGPNQTFVPATPGAENKWNNGGPTATTSDPGSQSFGAGGGGTNAVNICTAAEQQTAWLPAFDAAIVPPFSMGGLDLSTNGTFDPFTIEMAERGVTSGFKSPRLCQGAAVPCNDGSGNPGYALGAQSAASNLL
jgi:hypothetical protein